MAGINSKLQTSLLSQKERNRVRERFRATLAGLVELEVLRSKHKKMVEAALENRMLNCLDPELSENGKKCVDVLSGTDGCQSRGIIKRVRLTRSLSQDALYHSTGLTQRVWSSHSSEDLLLHSSQGYNTYRSSSMNLIQADSGSRASSGFYEDDEDIESTEENCTGSASSETHSSLASALARRPFHLYRSVMPADHKTEVIPSDILMSVADLCPETYWQDVSHMLQPQVVLEQRYRADLTTGQSGEVYSYPSPLHAVALQSPLYGLQKSSASAPIEERDQPRLEQDQLDNHNLLPTNLSDSHVSTGQNSPTLSEQHRLEQMIVGLGLGFRQQAPVAAAATRRQCKETVSVRTTLSTIPTNRRRAGQTRSLSTCSEDWRVSPKGPLLGGFRRPSDKQRSVVMDPVEGMKTESHRQGDTVHSLKESKGRCLSASDCSRLGHSSFQSLLGQSSSRTRTCPQVLKEREPRRYGQAFPSDSLPPGLRRPAFSFSD